MPKRMVKWFRFRVRNLVASLDIYGWGREPEIRLLLRSDLESLLWNALYPKNRFDGATLQILDNVKWTHKVSLVAGGWSQNTFLNNKTSSTNKKLLFRNIDLEKFLATLNNALLHFWVKFKMLEISCRFWILNIG